MEVYSVRNLTFAYPEQEKPALSSLSFSVEAGEFVTLVGPSGSGKSTLLRQLKPELTPHGARKGEILFRGTPLERLDEVTRAAKIGFVMQNPDNQLVTDKVWHELAFGLESLGQPNETVRRRTAEMASFFGIESWFYRNVADLSGGQKQLLNLASVMVMEPEVLILDEPTSQLDPIAATDFLAVLGRINRELGTTVILTEHRLEDVFPLSSRVMAMEEGALLCDGTPREVGERLRALGSSHFLSMPTPMRIWSAVENQLSCPVTVPEGREWLEQFSRVRPLEQMPGTEAKDAGGKTALSLREVWFRYERDGADVLRGLSIDAAFGEFLCVLGGNGTGKSTALSVISGANRPYRGEVCLGGRTALLPQDAQMLFAHKTVRKELTEVGSGSDELLRVIRLCRLETLLDRHPYDLSGGEQQRAALAKVLLKKPEILLLDEPTKGLDAAFKRSFAAMMRALTREGVCVVMVSHDVEFCAEYADRCALFFDGGIVVQDNPARFFSSGSFYTTSANRMARHCLPNAVTVGDVIAACGGSEVRETLPDNDGAPVLLAEEGSLLISPRPAPLPLWRKILAMLSGAAALSGFGYALHEVDLTVVLTTGGMSATAEGYRWVYALLLASLVLAALSINRKTAATPMSTFEKRDKIPPRTIAAAVMILLAVPLTILAGTFLLGDRKYYFISLLVILETMLPFLLVFEGRKPRPRELVIIGVLCAIGVAGRAAFLALPGFKPVAALVIVAGVAFGGETGFMVGAVTMFVSNMLFGQGPWTPWQMFAMGVIGFLSGILFRRGAFGRGRLALCVYGVLAVVVVYGGLMNPASVLMYQPKPTWEMILTAYLTGLPMDLVHGVSTAVILWFVSRPMLEKLDRIKVKYGLVE